MTMQRALLEQATYSLAKINNIQNT